MTPIDSGMRTGRRWVDLMSQKNIEFWAGELGCSQWQLLDAVAYVGLSVEDLRRHLRSNFARIEPTV